MRFSSGSKAMRAVLCAVLALALTLPLCIIPATAYQSAMNSSCKAFTQTAIDKMANMKDGDNIFALGSYDKTAYTTPAKYCESGLCQFVPQHNDNKWGRGYKGNGWSISGMANVGDGVIDAQTAYNQDGVLYFGVKNTNTKKVDANATLVEESQGVDVVEAGKYLTLCGWEFAADFTVDSFKIYFGKNAYADDFDILIGHLNGDEIVWEVAFEGTNVSSQFTTVTGTANALYSYEADFDKAYTGRFIQIATKTFDGQKDDSTTERSGYYGYVCTEFEVYLAEDMASAITNAAEFAAMEADGFYYLANDITLDATYTTTFTGYLNGNGHSIMNSVPVFESLGGSACIENVVLGSKTGNTQITSDDTTKAIGSLSNTVANPSNIFVDNIVNYTDIKAGYRCGGIIGQVNCSENGKVYTTITNCVNYGEIDAANMVGGIIGYAQRRTLNVDNCVNYGEIISTGVAGGIVGRFGMDKLIATDVKATITNCTNSGSVSGTYTGGIIGYLVGANLFVTDSVNSGTVTGSSKTGGILGSTTSNSESKEYDSNVTLERCVNTGNVTSTKDNAGGFCGYAYGSGSTYNIKCYYCINTGAINAGAWASQFVAYTNSTSTTINNCLAAGSIAAVAGKENSAFLCFIGSSSQKATKYKITNVYYVSTDTPTYFGYSKTAGNESAWDARVGITIVTPEDITSGKIADLLNTNAGSQIFGQKIGTDAAPVLGSSDRVFNNSGVYFNADPSMHTGASIRINSTADESGIRFSYDVDKAVYENLVALYGAANVKFGLILAPAAYDKGEFTKEALDAFKASAGLSSAAYLDITADAETPFTSTDTLYTFAGSLKKIMTNHYDLDFTARAYVEINDGGNVITVYSANTATRSVADVASAALASGSEAFTPDEIAILNAYAGN